MKRLILMLFLASIAWACQNKDIEGSASGKKQKNEEKEYINNLKQFRAEKDSAFKYDSHSPIPEEERASFKGLNYFEPDVKYYVIAKFIKHTNPDTLKILTTKPDDIRTMLRYGEFHFVLDNKEYVLQGYVNASRENSFYIFLPFTDLTTGKETYEGGRYLDINFNPGDSIAVLDFNLAYNPYCAYNSRYSCPLVPFENSINVKILAGEKAYKSH